MSDIEQVLVCRYCTGEVTVGDLHCCDKMEDCGEDARSVQVSDDDFFVTKEVAETTDDWEIESDLPFMDSPELDFDDGTDDLSGFSGNFGTDSWW